MKKIILACVLFICATSVMRIDAQISTSFGLKLNGNVTYVKLPKQKDGNDSFKPGVS